MGLYYATRLGGSVPDNVVHLPRLVPATFCFFNKKGIFHTKADGMMRENWTRLPNTPKTRRLQIIQDNKGSMPGGLPERASEFFIRIKTQDQQQLILPETM